MAEMKENQGQLNIELSEEMAEGTYANLVAINHSPTEFVLDFIQLMPGMPKAKVKSRVILTPEHTKRFLAALGENMAKYEQHFGSVTTHEPPPVPMNFGGPAGEA